MIIWGGKFGRLPLSQVDPRRKNRGRDHGSGGFNTWLVGAGVKGGTVYGATDDVGYKAVENPVSVSDFHATILHLLGMNFRNLTYQRHGLQERLTDQFPVQVISEILT